MSCERRVGADLRVADHGRDAHQLADRGTDSAVGLALEQRAVLEHQQGGHRATSASRCATVPAAIVMVQRPCSVRPANAQLREREAYGGATTQLSDRSQSARSAGAPVRRAGTGRSKARAGPADIRSITVESDTRPGATSSV